MKVGTAPNHLQREERFPAGTAIRAMKAWQDETRVELRKQLPTAAARGTFAADVERYFRTASFLQLAYPEDRQRDLRAWVPVFRARRRATIRAHEIEQQLQVWGATLSASTCSHRLDAISQLYTVLDGKAAANPARGCTRFQKPKPIARGLALQMIDRVIDEIPTMKTRARLGKTIARLKMMRWTGARPAQLRRLPPEAFDLDAALPSVLIPSAKGGKAARVPLLPEGVAASRDFLSSGCAAAWNTRGAIVPARWSCGSTNTTIARACRRLRIPPFTVYRLRHSVATTLRAAGVPIDDIRDTLGHTDATTTAIYAPPVTAVQMAQFEALRTGQRTAQEDGTEATTQTEARTA